MQFTSVLGQKISDTKVDLILSVALCLADEEDIRGKGNGRYRIRPTERLQPSSEAPWGSRPVRTHSDCLSGARQRSMTGVLNSGDDVFASQGGTVYGIGGESRRPPQKRYNCESR